MLAFFSRLSFVLAVFTVALAAVWHGVASAGIPAPDEKKVRAVIEAQLKAFAADNARLAFALATPALQAQFGTAENFMAMVRSSYPVVYAPVSVAFLKPEAQDADVIQRVRMTDRQGKVWLALYSLQRQKNGSWRISGCVVVESRQRFI